MESAYGTSFADVKAHVGGSEAQAGLTELGARAATHGNDIAFRESNPSEELVAHELAHVVQQRKGGGVQCKAVDVSREGDAAEQRADAAAAAVVRGEPVPDVGTASGGIHRAVETNGGTWDTAAYNPIDAPTGALGDILGCHIKLDFKANDLVESTKIGLIQSVKAMKSSAAGGARDTVATGVGDPEEGQLIMTAGQKDPGREIDRAVHPGARALPNTSPVYGVHNSPGSMATQLTDGTPTTGTSQWGSHEKIKLGFLEMFKPPVPARIDDTPRRQIEFAGQTYHHTFESTAIALEGPIPANTYLGSVSWGWSNDATGKVTVDPLTVVQAGPPSSEFMGAAARWNAATFTETGTANTHASVDIPTTTVTSGSIAAPDMRTVDLLTRIPAVKTESTGLPAGTDKTNKEFELRALEDELERRKVRVHVLVKTTEDWTGSDNVYVKLTAGGKVARSGETKLNDGQSHTFLLPLADLLPLTGSINVKVYDADWPDGDDLISHVDWTAPWSPASDNRPWDGAEYQTTVSFEK
jgi:hypothetical protein